VKPRYFFAIALFASSSARAQQVADSSFDVSVARPAFTTRHPIVVIDEDHLNFHTLEGRYMPFARLIRNDGADVRRGTSPFSAKSLKDVDVLVIANALGQGATAGADDSPPAFTSAECDAVRDWVRNGGSLLLIADHTPFGAAAFDLAQRFGVTFGKGFAQDTSHYMRGRGPSLLEFTLEDSLLGDHPILRGRDSTERIRRVLTFTGQSMTLPNGAVSLLKLSPTAREAPTRADVQRNFTIPVSGPTQGLAMTYGKGRVVMLGEAAFMSAQLAGNPNGPQPRFQMGMNQPGSDDKQFALNVVRWLAGALQ